MTYVKFCIYYKPFVFMKIIFFIIYLIMVLEFFFVKSKYKGDNFVKKPKWGFPH